MNLEDKVIKRVCFCPTINGCLNALGATTGDVFLVYVPTNLEKLKIFSGVENKVPDWIFTKEVWVMNRVEMKYLMYIKVIDTEYVHRKVVSRLNGRYQYQDYLSNTVPDFGEPPLIYNRQYTFKRIPLLSILTKRSEYFD